ncbi:MAG TPA: type II toxin-antitoxin system Phd/YefM family antitoxin [Polyangiaceae bacterium]
MSHRSVRWSVAAAKAELSRVVESAQREPQVIERRGKPVAVVIGFEQYEGVEAAERWRRFLEFSKETSAAGGGQLRVPGRKPRRSPLGAR